MKRFLGTFTVGLLLSLVAITVMGGVAFGAIVGERFQAESRNLSLSSGISVQDSTNDEGQHIRWANTGNTSTLASISISPTATVNQVVVRGRQPSTGTAVMALYSDGAKVGTFTPPKGSNMGTVTVTLTSPIAAGTTPTFAIGPNANLANFVIVDWFELHNTGSTGGDTTPPAAPTITGEPAEGGTDSDGNVSFTFTGAESGGTFECSNVPQGQAVNYSAACPSPKPYSGLANGSYTFSVRQKDAAGNVGAAATRNYSVSTPTGGDTTPPLAPTITGGPAAGSTDPDGTVSFTWTGAEAGDTFQCSNVISGQVDNFSPCPPSPTITYTGLPNGSYIFKVRQRDAAGNVGAAASRNYSVSTPTGGDTTPPSAQDPSDGWFQKCARTKTGKFDPIVYPTTPPPVGNQKLFFGATNISYNSTKTSLLNGGTTCRFKNGTDGGNRSAYWVPDLQLRDGKTLVGGKQLNAYYRKGASSVDANDIEPFPDGLKMVIRDRETNQTDLEWYCSNINGEGNNGKFAERPYNCTDGTYPYVSAHITFPQCGNRDLDTTDPQKYPVNDHISHMVYPSSSGCPPSHPNEYPRLFIAAKYNTWQGDGARLAGGADPATDFRSYFFEAWKPGRLQFYIESCIGAGINCNETPPAG
jgi:Domain of unknown function (DUF1996)